MLAVLLLLLLFIVINFFCDFRRLGVVVFTLFFPLRACTAMRSADIVRRATVMLR